MSLKISKFYTTWAPDLISTALWLDASDSNTLIQSGGGGASSGNGTAGTANTGGGGGGSGATSPGIGGAGGSGIVIIRYVIS